MFDPFGFFGRQSGDRPPRAADVPWLDAWVRATTSWLDPATWAEAAGLPGRASERMLFDLVEGVARRFAGRPVKLERRGRVVDLVVDTLRVDRRRASQGDTDVEARVEVHDLTWAGLELARADAVV